MLFKQVKGHKSPITKLLKSLDDSKTLSSARGAAYELEVAYDLHTQGHKNIRFGEKLRNATAKKDFDVVTDTLLAESKSIFWEIYSKNAINDEIASIVQQAQIAKDIGTKFALYSKYPMPEFMKVKLRNKNITFFED